MLEKNKSLEADDKTHFSGVRTVDSVTGEEVKRTKNKAKSTSEPKIEIHKY